VNIVGKPVFNKEIIASFGSWMKDPLPRISNETIWMTINEINTLLEYSNKTMFKTDILTKKHPLSYSFHVSAINLYIIKSLS